MKLIFKLLSMGGVLCALTFAACTKEDENLNNNGNGENNDNNEFNDDSSLRGSISENKTLPDLGLDVDYIVDGMLSIEGNALLTIEPGVTIMFTGTNGGIEVGEDAGLKMVGTADKPIKFVGPANNPNNGSWDHIKYNSTRSDNQMEYVYMLRGGSSDQDWAGVLMNYGRLSMKNCMIDGSLCNGVDIYQSDDNKGYFTAFEGNTIKNCAGYPIYDESGVTRVKNFGRNIYTSNGKNYIFVYGGDELTDDFTLTNQGIPYLFGSLNMGGQYTFTIEAGTQMLFNGDSYMNIEGNTILSAEGTDANPIVIRGLRNEPGFWNGVTYYSTSASSKMVYCKIYDAGHSDSWNNQCLYIDGDSRGTFTNCVFGNSQYYGVVIDEIGNFGRINHSGCTFTNNEAGNVLLWDGGSYNGQDYEGGQVLDALP